MMVASALSKPSAFSRGASKNELMKSAPPPSNFEGSVLGCINQMCELFVRSRRLVNERTTQISPNCSNLNFQWYLYARAVQTRNFSFPKPIKSFFKRVRALAVEYAGVERTDMPIVLHLALLSEAIIPWENEDDDLFRGWGPRVRRRNSASRAQLSAQRLGRHWEVSLVLSHVSLLPSNRWGRWLIVCLYVLIFLWISFFHLQPIRFLMDWCWIGFGAKRYS